MLYRLQYRDLAVKSEAGVTYRVRISNLATRQEAAALGAKLKGQMGIAEPKISK